MQQKGKIFFLASVLMIECPPESTLKYHQLDGFFYYNGDMQSFDPSDG